MRRPSAARSATRTVNDAASADEKITLPSSPPLSLITRLIRVVASAMLKLEGRRSLTGIGISFSLKCQLPPILLGLEEAVLAKSPGRHKY